MNYVSDFTASLAELRESMNRQLESAFRPGTTANHKTQAALYINFCDNYGVQAINSTVDTICLYAAYLTHRFKSAQSVNNYISGVRFSMHNCLDIYPKALDSFELKLMTRACKLILRRPPTVDFHSQLKI